MNACEFGSYLRRMRTDCGMTQEDLAEKLNVTVSSISKWERGKSLPELTRIEDIASVFNVSASDILQCKSKSNDIRQPVWYSNRKVIGCIIACLIVACVLMIAFFSLRNIKTVHGYLNVTMIEQKDTEYFLKIEPYYEDMANYTVIISNTDEWVQQCQIEMVEGRKYQIEYIKTGKIKDGTYLHNIISLKEK